MDTNGDRPRPVGINHVALEVDDVDRAVAFYGRLVELRGVERAYGGAFLDLGDQFIALVPPGAGEDRHWVSGDRGASEWLLTGTTTTGERIAVRGCDLWEFRDCQIIRKDSYWKIVE